MGSGDGGWLRLQWPLKLAQKSTGKTSAAGDGRRSHPDIEGRFGKQRTTAAAATAGATQTPPHHHLILPFLYCFTTYEHANCPPV